MRNVPSAEARQVTTTRALKSMPVWLRIPGLTKMMYDIVTNVVIPARTSVMKVLPVSRILNNDMIIIITLRKKNEP